MGVNVPTKRPDAKQIDLNLIRDDEDRIDHEVRALQGIAQASGKTK